MGIFDAHLTIKEKADKGQLLPEILNTRDIAVLFSDDNRERDSISQVMVAAIASHKLKIQASRNYSNAYLNDCGRVFVVWIYEQDEDKGNYAGPVEIHKDAFLDWLKSEGEPLPVDSSLLNWLSEPQTEALGNAGAGNHAITEPKEPELSKLEKQQEAILNVIKAKKFKPMEIPDNEKGTIKLICESDYSKLFEAETAFDRAWKHGINKLWRMEHHESYAKRGNN